MPSKVQERPEHWLVNAATGGVLAGGGPEPGWSTTVTVEARLASLVVAARPDQAPGGTGPLSASSAAIRPLPVPMDSSRGVAPAGGTQSVVVDDLSAQ